MCKQVFMRYIKLVLVVRLRGTTPGPSERGLYCMYSVDIPHEIKLKDTNIEEVKLGARRLGPPCRAKRLSCLTRSPRRIDRCGGLVVEGRTVLLLNYRRARRRSGTRERLCQNLGGVSTCCRRDRDQSLARLQLSASVCDFEISLPLLEALRFIAVSSTEAQVYVFRDVVSARSKVEGWHVMQYDRCCLAKSHSLCQSLHWSPALVSWLIRASPSRRCCQNI